MKRSKKKIVRGTIIVVLSLSFFICLLVYNSSQLTVTYYDIDTNLTESIRIVQLTDLHNMEFGKSNRKLIDLVDKQKPDMIVMTGDMLTFSDEDTSIVTDLISSLALISPVYFGYGNHETYIERSRNKELSRLLAEAGAAVLDNTYSDIEIKGQQLRIGGYMGFYRQPQMMTMDADQKQVEYRFFDDFENTDRFKVLLNHIPTSWLDWNCIDMYPVDIVFSGHYHGGQWVLPFIGPVFAPYAGLNPPYAKGLFKGKKAICILSAGLGNEYWWLPRINNPPEIVVVNLI